MSIKTEDIVKGAIVITSMPKNPLKDGNHLVVMGEDGDYFNGSTSLPFGIALTITEEPKRKHTDVAAKYVGLETFGGKKFTTFLSYLKPRVTLADED